MTPGSTVTAPPLDEIVDRIDEIATLPDAALRVIEVTNDESAGASELAAVIQGDMALSATVLRIVNSSAYGVRNRVTNIPRAIGLLGFRQIRNLAIAASLRATFRDEGRIGSYHRPQLWRHLASVGVGARLIAMRVGLKAFEDAFLAGLLHDIGIALCDQYLNGAFRRLMANLDETISLEENERRVLGVTHTELGARIAEKWRFPPAVAESIQFHHHPEGADPSSILDVCCVTVANMLCTLRGNSSIGVNLVQASPLAVQQLGLNRADLETLHADLDAELARHQTLFTL